MYGICFYPTAANSPVNKLLDENNINYSNIIVFSNASWQDCPNTGHSTIGHLTFYQGGLIAANSGVPLPLAMSSAEAEYMATWAASMQATVVHSLLYNIRFLGTPEYKLYECQVKFPPAILCVDNAATIAMSKSAKLTKKTRHIARHFHFVCDGVEHCFSTQIVLDHQDHATC